MTETAPPGPPTWRVSLALFALTAWPAWLVALPPFQDLPNHLASAYVQLHPEQYPELVSNGFFKTNSALFLFLHLVAPLVGLRVAAKLFITLVVAAGAVIYPRVVARFGSRNLYSASFVLVPFVHNWFVAMGMLDFALGVPLSLAMLLALDAHRRTPSAFRGIGVVLVSLAVWYAHAFSLVIACLLAGIEVVATGAWRDLRPKWSAAKVLLVPLLPVTLLTVSSVVTQIHGATELDSATLNRGVPSLLYSAFAEWFWPLTKWTISSFAACAVIAFYGLRRIKQPSIPFFSTTATIALGLAYVLVPHVTHRWYYMDARFLPYFWVALLLRMPEKLPRVLTFVLAAASLEFSVGLGIEEVKVASDFERFERGEPYVPEHARTLTFVFDRKGRYGDNTFPMLHLWGLYAIDRHTHTPHFFAHSPSFPITEIAPPPPELTQLVLEGFEDLMHTSVHFCTALRTLGLVPHDCAASYRAAWADFWQNMSPRFDRVVFFEPTADVRAAVPSSFRTLFDEDGVMVLATSQVTGE
jgi:hypothetical protein